MSLFCTEARARARERARQRTDDGQTPSRPARRPPEVHLYTAPPSPAAQPVKPRQNSGEVPLVFAHPPLRRPPTAARERSEAAFLAQATCNLDDCGAGTCLLPPTARARLPRQGKGSAEERGREGSRLRLSAMLALDGGEEEGGRSFTGPRLLRVFFHLPPSETTGRRKRSAPHC